MSRVLIDWHRWKASEAFPGDTSGKGLELMVEGLYGPHSRRWVPIQRVWRGTVEGQLGHPEANVNFSLRDGVGWIAVPHDRIIETKRSISY